MTDRITLDEQFKAADRELVDTVAHGSFIFGLTRSGSSDTDLQLCKGDELLNRFTKIRAFQLSKVVEGEEIYFFAFHKRATEADGCLLVYSTNNGSAWRDASISLVYSNFKLVRVAKASQAKFIFGGVRALLKSSFSTFSFELQSDGRVDLRDWETIPLRSTVQDFDLVVVDKDAYWLVLSERHSQSPSIRLVQLDKSSRIPGLQPEPLAAPNAVESNQGIKIKCQLSLDELSCASTGAGVYSFVSKYKMNLKPPPTESSSSAQQSTGSSRTS